MSEVKVADPFESATLPEAREAIADLSEKAAAIFARYKGDNGEVQYHEMSGEDGDEVRELNVKLAHARTRFEKLSELSGAKDTVERLSAYMRQPITPLPPQPTGRTEAKTLAERVHAELQANPFREGKEWSFTVEDEYRTTKGVKAVLGTDSALTGVGAQYPPESVRIGTIVDTLYQPHNIGPMIPQVVTGQNAIPYMVETVSAQGASETEEGALGTEAQFDYAETVEPIRKITVLQPITEELLADEGPIRAIVDSRLRQFMGNREDLQLLKGDGTAPNLEGILNRTGVQNVNYSLTGATPEGLAEAALSAANLVRTVFQTPSAYTMQIGTWEYIRLAKDGQGAYLFAGPADAQQPRLWGLPVVTNENLDGYTVATNVPILVGDWAGAATIFRRQGVTVQVSDSHDDRFARGVLTIRLLERLGLVVWRPSGFATVTRIA